MILLKLVFLVAGIFALLKTKAGKKIGRYFPAPFWVYFLSIVLGAVGILPHQSSLYGWLTLHALPMALFLMLVGSPINMLLKLGPKALVALVLATGSMFAGILISFLLFHGSLGPDSWKAAGTMLATWTGGSANMAAVKEMVDLSDAGMAPLIIMDTFLSYGWLALLILGSGFQKKFDKKATADISFGSGTGVKKPEKRSRKYVLNIVKAFVIGLLMASIIVYVGGITTKIIPFLSLKAWVILLATTVAALLSMTPAVKMERWDASGLGTFILYVVLATYGAKTQVGNITGIQMYISFGLCVLLVHGIILVSVGKIFKFPLFLLATASQANIGGPISAPIVAGIYRNGAAHVGVLMAVAGAILGTYIGAFGGWICKILAG